MRPGPAALLAVLAVLWSPAGAQASKPRCRLEHIDLSALDRGGVIKATGGLVELEGLGASDQAAKSFRLLVGNKSTGRAERLEPFERSGQDLYMILAVEISALYAPAFDKIKEALQEFLESVPRAKVKLIQFGTEIEPSPTFLPAPAVSQQLDDINPDDQGEVKLLDALTAGLVSLNKLPPGPAKDKNGQPHPPPRRVIVVLSDGLNALMDRKSFKRVGDLLKQSNVPLFPVAFSPRDDRGPLLNLGELAKRSAGTFRWAQKDDGLKEQFQNLAEELNKTGVLQFPAKKLTAETLAGAVFTLQCGELRSTPLTLAGGLPPPPPSRWWQWVLGILGGLLGLWGLAQGALWLLNRRSRKLGLTPVAGYPPGTLPPGAGYPPGTLPPGAGYPPGTLPPGAGYPPGTLPPGAGYPPGTLPPAGYAGGYPAGAQPPGVVAVGYAERAGGRVSTATLIGIGALGGQRIKVEASLRLGSAVSGPGCFTVSSDPSVAPTHCELRRDGAGYALVDFGSPAGSFINDRRVSGTARLADGDLVRLGDGTQLKFRLDD